MGAYRPLFSIQVGHSYFSNGEWRGLDFVPTPDTSRTMKGADLLARPMNGGMAVFYNEERTGALRLYAEEANDALPFRFKVCSGDRTFSNYTAPTARNRDAVLCFDNRAGFIDPDNGRCRLSKDQCVSDEDLRDMDELVAAGILSENDRRTPPDFVVEIIVKPGQSGNDDGATGWESQSCYFNFAARSSFWRYFLLDDLGGNNPTIVDPDQRVQFESCGMDFLAGDRPARTFRSNCTIPLQEMSTCRFQLKAEENGVTRVLIKRLPAASKNKLGMIDIDGKKEIVFENYINF
jgi:hypothetical protein